MKNIQVYEPPMCSASGVCGTQMDPDVTNFSAMLAQFHMCGIKIERYNLALQPLAFAENAAVKALMIAEGTEVLPVIFWDGELHLKGRYPTKADLPAWFRAAFPREGVAA